MYARQMVYNPLIFAIAEISFAVNTDAMESRKVTELQVSVLKW